MTLLELEELLHARRFSAVLVARPEGVQLAQTLRQTCRIANFTGENISARPDWVIQRGNFTSSRSYFSNIPKDAFSVKEGYAQGLYIGAANLIVDQLERPTILVATPYIRMLDEVVSKLADASPTELEYLTPSMGGAFSFFHDRTFTWIDATRISVADDQDPGVSLVSLSGRHPLRSALRMDLEGTIGPAHSIRLTTSAAPNPTHVHVDRYGNFNWYLRDAAHMRNPVEAISLMSDAKLFKTTTTLPTRMRLKDG
jgi:hypothetical protein